MPKIKADYYLIVGEGEYEGRVVGSLNLHGDFKLPPFILGLSECEDGVRRYTEFKLKVVPSWAMKIREIPDA